MIPLVLPARADGDAPYVGRVGARDDPDTLSLVEANDNVVALAGARGLIAIEGVASASIEGDVLLIDPLAGRVERLIRRDSRHNTLLVTERCDQLCVMCSQPPKKTHHDRFALLEDACLLADLDAVLGITGGEPLLYKDQLLGMIERVREKRPDLAFHVLTNGQHFEPDDIERLATSNFDSVQWGIPLYSDQPDEHDAIVGKSGAFARLEDSLATLAIAGASIELRTVVMTRNVARLPMLAAHIARRLPFIATWSIMQLENIGYARRRWTELRFDHARDFTAIGQAVDQACLAGIDVRLFNFPRCTVPPQYRARAVASISDWKQRFGVACGGCRERAECSGFFEWHPSDDIEEKVNPL